MALPRRGSTHSSRQDHVQDTSGNHAGSGNASDQLPLPGSSNDFDSNQIDESLYLESGEDDSNDHNEEWAPVFDDADNDDPNPQPKQHVSAPRHDQNTDQDLNDYQEYDDDVMSPEQIMQLTNQNPPRNDQYQDRQYQSGDEHHDYDDNSYNQDGLQPQNSRREPVGPSANNRPQFNVYKRNDDGQSNDDQYDPNEMKRAEARSVQHIEERQKRDNRNVRRSHASSIQPRSASDLAKKAKTYRMITLTVIFLVLLLAGYQTLVPKAIPSEGQIASIARQVNNDTGFPLQEGSGVAQQFITAYLQADGSASTAQVMDMFYKGVSYSDATNDAKGGDNGSYQNLTIPTTVKQKIEYGPYVYGEKVLDVGGSTATYQLGALVYRLDMNGNVIKDSSGSIKYKMIFYQVDLGYDTKIHKFSVSENSPTLIPEPTISSPGSTVKGYLLPGNGEEVKEIENDTMTALVKQFMQAWAASDSDALTTLVSRKGTPETKTGLHGSVTLDGDLDYKVYGAPSSDPYYRVLATVEWNDKVDDSNTIKQKSTYVIKVAKDGDKLSVVDIQSYPWYPQNNADE